MKKVVLDDIAKELGVSKSLVSFVMNGRAKEMRVSDTMAERILLKAKEMGYQPNYLARALRTGKSYTLGLIVADIANPFFAKLARSIENEALNFKYNVIFGSSDESKEKSEQLIQVFLDKKVDGLIICPSSGDRELIESLNSKDISYVLIDRYFEDVKSNVVVVDNENGAFQIVQRQIEKGAVRFAYIGLSMNLINAKNRLNGFKKALRNNALNIDETLIHGINFEEIEKRTPEIVSNLLNSGKAIDCIVFGNNHLASLGVSSIREYNRNNINKVSVCSFDGFDHLDLLEIPIVYGVQPIEKIGKMGVELMMKQIQSERPMNIMKTLNIKIKEILIDQTN